MAYSPDLRKRILDFIQAGGKKSEPARLFTVARSTIDRWLAAEDPLAIKKPGPKKMRVIDEEALRKQVADCPDLTQKERATHFGVSEFCIGYGLRKLGITRKKTLGYKQRCDEKRATYCQDLAVKEAAGKSVVYVDECGFCAERFIPYAYAPQGAPVLGLISSQRTRKTTMVAARITINSGEVHDEANNRRVNSYEDTFTAFCFFDGSCNAERFNKWLEEDLCPLLSSEHLVIMETARIHKTERTREQIEAVGAELLFLPAYSPDYNPIEHDFATIKRLREYNADIPLNEVINMYH